MYSLHYIDSLDAITAAQWNGCCHTDYPFISHAFLLALEASGAVGGDSGWQSLHAVVYRGEHVVAVMPMYLKSHSYGEYVFDFEWANAYHRNHLTYYPKLVTAIPYTPATGPRLGILQGEDEAAIRRLLLGGIIEYCQQHHVSGWHQLFTNPDGTQSIQEKQLLQRRAVHFKWHNRGYTSFDHFLDSFTSRKRKSLRKERRCIEDNGLSVEVFTGREIDAAMWQTFAVFYRQTYAKRSGHGGYLNADFFHTIGQSLADNIVLVMAKQGDHYVAGALNFKDKNSLYGRYWGCIDSYNHLHFELCYYRGIEYCIAHGLRYFDPGVQGEHKIQRGFEPYYTHSQHYLVHREFNRAVGQFLRQEDHHIQRYKHQAEDFLPFKKTA